MLENFLKDRNLNILIILFSIITYFSTNYTQILIIFYIITFCIYLKLLLKNEKSFPITEAFIGIYIIYYTFRLIILKDYHTQYKYIDYSNDFIIGLKYFSIFFLTLCIYSVNQKKLLNICFNNFIRLKNLKIENYKIKLENFYQNNYLKFIVIGTVGFILNRSNYLVCKEQFFFPSLHMISYFFYYLTLFGISIFIANIETKKFIHKIIFFLIFIPMFFLITLANSMSAMLSLMLCLVLLINITSFKKKDFFKYIIIVLILISASISFMLVKKEVRSRIDPNINISCTEFDNSVKEMLKVYNYTYFNVEPQLLNFEEELDKSMAEILLIRLDNSYLFAHSIKFLKANKNYFDGESYFNDNIDWKVEFYKRMGILPLGYKGGTAYNFPILIESYANYKITGLIIFSIIFPMFILLIQIISKLYNSKVINSFLIVSVCQFFIIENRLVFTLKNSIYAIALFMISSLIIFGFQKIQKS